MDMIQEQQFEEAVSEASGTEMIRVGPREEAKMPFVPETQAISNQLELASMISDQHNSVMGSSPIKSSRIPSTRGTKGRKGDK